MKLYKDGKLVESTSDGTIFVDVDRMGIQLVDRKTYSGRYTIQCSNTAGTGEITFYLKVQGKYQGYIVYCNTRFIITIETGGYVQRVEPLDGRDPTRW